MGALLFPVIVAAVVGVFIVTAQQTRKTLETWGRAATKLGLDLTKSRGSRPAMKGFIGGLRVSVHVYTTGGKNKQFWTKYSAAFPERGTAIGLKRQSGLSRVTKFFGALDAEIGDVTFDDAFMIKEESATRAAMYLTLPRRTMLLKMFSLYRDVELTPDRLEIVTRGQERDADKLITHTRRLVSAARVLGGLSENEPAMRESLERRLAGDMNAATASLHNARYSPDDFDTPIAEAELLAESGRLADADDILTSLHEDLPADEEIAGLQRAIDRMEPTEPAPGDSDVDLQELLDDLFVSNRLSFETAEIFDEHYLGRGIRWSGQFKSGRDVPDDLDFRAGAGAKMVIAIAEVEHDLYGMTEVNAIVHVPTGTASHLRRGDTVTFTGKLLKADSMMRNVFVEDARIE